MCAVDGKPETVLHCNYIMRGVYSAPGAHTVEFRFQPPVGPMYASLVAVGLGLVLLGYLGLADGKAPRRFGRGAQSGARRAWTSQAGPALQCPRRAARSNRAADVRL